MKENWIRLENKIKDIEQQLSQASMTGDVSQLEKCSREYSKWDPAVKKIVQYRKLETDKNHFEEMINSDKTDTELRSMAEEELILTTQKMVELEKEIDMEFVPKDVNSDRDAIMEIRAGTGGMEAGLFANDLFRMYSRYAESKKWKTEVLSVNNNDLGGIKEVIFAVHGKNVWNNLKNERGVHRVQRVPVTESSGRIHTSTCSVAVLLEAEDTEVEIKAEDLRIDVYCSSGKGGQHVNKTASAVRITHLPTNMVVQCQDERSQLQNKTKAMKILRSRLLAEKQNAQDKSISEERKSQVGTMERAEKIRTYNFPQDRITDHRIGLSVHNMEKVLDGAIDELVDALHKFEHDKEIKEYVCN